MSKTALVIAVSLLATAVLAGQTLTVQHVHPDSPAEAAGMKAGDRIVRLDGKTIDSHDSLREVMAAHEPGDEVPLAVERDGETVELKLTFGEASSGGVSIGISIEIAGAGDGAATAECLAWIDETYGLPATIERFGLDLAGDYETMRACVTHDTGRMTSENAVRYCDNIFKAHCAGIELLGEIAEAQVAWCEARLEIEDEKAWRSCGRHRVHDRYAQEGVVSDEAACRAAYEACR